MDYMEILDEIVGNPHLLDYLNEGDTVSPLFIGMDGSVAVHLLLVLQPVEEAFVPAYAIALRAPAEAPVLASRVEAGSISMDDLEQLPMEQYAALYPRVFELAAQPERDTEAQAVVNQYQNLLHEDTLRKWCNIIHKQFPNMYWE